MSRRSACSSFRPVQLKAVVLGAGAMLGGAIGNMVKPINERLRIAIVVIGWCCRPCCFCAILF
jgi:hypothetical protein